MSIPRVSCACAVAGCAASGTFSWDIVRGVLTWDERARRVLRISSSGVAETPVRDFLASVEPSHKEAVEAAFERTAKGACSYDVEFPCKLGDGSVRWIAAHGSVESDAEGRPVRVAGICVDRTDRQHAVLASKAARDVLDELRALQSAFIADADLALAFERLLTLALEATGSDCGIVTELDTRDDNTALTHAIRTSDGGPGTMKIDASALQGVSAAVIASGEPVYVPATAEAMACMGIPIERDGAVLGVLAVTRGSGNYDEAAATRIAPLLDTCTSLFTAAKREAARRRASTPSDVLGIPMSALVDSTTAGIVAVDSDLRILAWNPAAAAMFKRTPTELIGTSFETLLPERYRALPARHVRELQSATATATGRTTGRLGEIFGLRAGSGEFPMDAAITLVPLPDRTLYTLTLRDGTDRSRAEGARQQLETRLRQAQKMEAIGTLAGGIAHDFNNILAAIVPNVELAQESLPVEHPAREELSDVLQASLRARDLVKQILAFSQHRKAKPQVLYLSKVVDEATKHLRPNAPPKVTLETRLSDCPPVYADASQIHQVLTNLCNNAFQAMPFGGTLTVEVSSVHVDVDMAAAHNDLIEGEYARLTVRDTGSGMNAATMDRIFEPFFTTKALGQGTGLGLAVVHGIVKAHGAGVEVESEVGRGSTFYIWFPVVDPDAPRTNSAMPSRAPTSSGAPSRGPTSSAAPSRAPASGNTPQS